MMTTDTLIMGDFNAHHSVLHSSSTNSPLENMISGSNFGILNWDSPTRVSGNANPSSPGVSLFYHFYLLEDEYEHRLRPELQE